jgi:hypothetical protein
MGIVKEPLNVDFIVENRPLTKEEEKQISNYILSQKKKQKSVISKNKQKI